jgi:predicted glycogen debranching enzyme
MIFNNKQSHEQLISKEWLVTNGLGGYASSTIIGENTRRYHGLLVAAFNPPTQRNVLVSKIEEQLQVNGTNYWLSTNSFPSVTHPEGYKWLESFERKPLPESVFASNTFRLA